MKGTLIKALLFISVVLCFYLPLSSSPFHIKKGNENEPKIVNYLHPANNTSVVAETSTTPNVVVSSNSPVCEGMAINLMESGGDAISWLWSGPNSFISLLQNPNIPSAGSEHNGTYCVTITDATSCTATACTTMVVNNCCTPTILNCTACDDGFCLGTNEFVFNGGFGLGNIGFTTGLPFGFNCGCQPGSYCVDDNARDKCTTPGWNPVQAPNCTDNYMIVDGVVGLIWQQQTALSVIAGNNYNFAFSVYTEISGAPPPTLALVINGVVVLPGIISPPGAWARFCVQWTPIVNGPVQLAIWQTTAGFFDDYGIDDISFKECASTFFVSTFPDVTICNNGSFNFSTTMFGGTPPFNCVWSPSMGLSNVNDCNPVLSNPPFGMHTYCVTVTDANGCTAMDCVEITSACCEEENTTTAFSTTIFNSKYDDAKNAQLKGLSGLENNPGEYTVLALSDSYNGSLGNPEIHLVDLNASGGVLNPTAIYPNVSDPVKMEKPTAFAPSVSGYVVTGAYGTGGTNGDDLLLLQTNGITPTAWHFGSKKRSEIGYDVLEYSNQHIMAVGRSLGGDAPMNVFIAGIRFNIPYARNYQFGESSIAYAITEMPSYPGSMPPYFGITGKIGDDILLMVVDGVGNLSVAYRIDLGEREEGLDILNLGNELIITGTYGNNSSFWNPFLLKLKIEDGTLTKIFANRYDVADSNFETTESITLAADGNYVIAGSMEIPIGFGGGGPVSSKAIMIEVDRHNDGQIVNWAYQYLNTNSDYKSSEFKTVITTQDGGFLSTGSSRIPVPEPFPSTFVKQVNDIYVVKTDPEGRLPPSDLTCMNCISVLVDSLQPAIEGILPERIESNDFELQMERKEVESDQEFCSNEIVIDTCIMICECCVSPQNLVINGDFELGDTGFTSDYASPGLNPGQYRVTNNPFPFHSGFICMEDHTSGAGNMMVINGAIVPGQDVWCELVAVTPGMDYNFSAFVAAATNLTQFFPANLQVSINGTSIGTFTTSTNICKWEEFCGSWSADPNTTTANICITDLSTVNVGNDFMLDDIHFSKCLKESEKIQGVKERISTLDLDKEFIDNNSINIFPNPTTNLLTISLKEGVFKEGDVIQLYNLAGTKTYSYQAVAPTSNVELNLRELPDGLYLIKIQIGKQLFHEKILKQ